MILDPSPTDGLAQWAVFTPPQDATVTRGYRTWSKPPGCSMIYVYVQCSGGGGGGGFTGAAGTARGGGGGGGAGGSLRLWVPAWMVPDTLYIRPGMGGASGAASAAGSAGTATIVSTVPSTGAFSTLINQAGGGGGGAGTGTAAGTAGSAGTISINGIVTGKQIGRAHV